MKISELAKWAIENNCYDAELEVEKYNETYNAGTTSYVYPELKDFEIHVSETTTSIVLEV